VLTGRSVARQQRNTNVRAFVRAFVEVNLMLRCSKFARAFIRTDTIDIDTLLTPARANVFHL
jgi:hypothetical protein